METAGNNGKSSIKLAKKMAEGTEEEELAVFRRVRDEIRTQVEAFLSQSAVS
jgi:hypothetical protein